MNIRTLLILFFSFLWLNSLSAQDFTLEQGISLYQKRLSSPTNNILYPIIDKQSKYYDNFLLLKSFSELKEGSYWSAYWDLKRTYNNVQKNLKVHPNDSLSGLLLSIISTTLSVVPQEYQWAMKLVGLPKVDIKNAKYIADAKKSNTWIISFQAYTADLLLQTFLLKNEGNKSIDQYHTLFGDTYYGKIILAWVYNKRKEHHKNIFLLNTLNSNEINNFGYYYYLLGTSYFYIEDYINATKYLNQYLLISDADYVKITKYRLFLIEWLINNRDLDYLLKLKKEIERSGNENLNLDKSAQNFATQENLPNKKLMYTRVLYDGGNYTEADSILSQLNSEQFSDNNNLEYNYRYARVKQALNDTTLAIKYYLNVIEKGGAKPKKYFTANAALNLGILYESLNDISKAAYFYKKAYSYPKHTYKNSIDSEAKRRLNTL